MVVFSAKLDQFRSAWETLCARARGQSGSTLILVAPDADGICAARIIESLLSAENIIYKLAAVGGYMDIAREIRGCSEQVRGPSRTLKKPVRMPPRGRPTCPLPRSRTPYW
jgi:hypothetical protein